MRLLRVHKSVTFNALSLMTATVATNALGLVFWTFAARLDAPRIVGRAAAAVAALTLLATISQLNLTNVFVRLLPSAGRLGWRLIARGYLAVIALSLLWVPCMSLSGLGAGVVRGGTARAGGVRGRRPGAGDFRAAGLRADRAPPGSVGGDREHLVRHGQARPAAGARAAADRRRDCDLVGRARRCGGDRDQRAAVLAGPARGGAYRGHVACTPPPDVVRRRRICGAIWATATTQVMPLIVVWRLGPAQVAYFTLPWLISMGITVLLWNVASAFVVELAGAHEHSSALLHRTLMLWAGVVTGALLVCVFAAGPLLSLAGASYAAHGTELLRLIGCSRSLHCSGRRVLHADVDRPARLAAGRVPSCLRRRPAQPRPWCCCRTWAWSPSDGPISESRRWPRSRRCR